MGDGRAWDFSELTWQEHQVIGILPSDQLDLLTPIQKYPLTTSTSFEEK